MQPALLLVMSIWLASGPGEDAQDAAKRLYEKYDYQRDLFPGGMRGSRGAGGGTAEDPDATPAEDPDATPAEDPTGSTGGDADGAKTGTAGDAAGHPRGETWSRDGWREDLRREIEEHRGRAQDRGDPSWRERELREPRRRSSGGGALASLLEVLVWVVLAVCGVTIVAALVRNWGGRAAELEAAAIAAGEQTPKAALDAPRSEAEALAAQGRFDEAVHLLLLNTIQALVRARPGGLPEAWTSREIERAMPMPQAARVPFGALVDTVEASLFGGCPVDEPAWTRCLDRFRTFESAYGVRRA